jgi:hypothetical protein
LTKIEHLPSYSVATTVNQFGYLPFFHLLGINIQVFFLLDDFAHHWERFLTASAPT